MILEKPGTALLESEVVTPSLSAGKVLVRVLACAVCRTDLHVVDARDRFLSALAGVTDPQQKRKIIGKVFIDVFKHEAKSIPDAQFLAQGTLYPDVIESGGAVDGPAATIKLHHNVGGLPAELGFDLIEPLRDLIKDEVRRLGPFGQTLRVALRGEQSHQNEAQDRDGYQTHDGIDCK